MAGDKTTVQRLCLDCEVDISHRGPKAQRCEPCSKERGRILSRQRSEVYYQENRDEVLQKAETRRQTPEYKQTREEWKEKNPAKFQEYRVRKKLRHREKTGYNPEGRTCETCNTDISHMGHRAKKCMSCANPPNRTCTVCHAEIRNRGASEYCSDQCKKEDQQSKELQGYTKTCTKCKQRKPHTEFGLHNELRRSSCKPCEVKDQLERFRNFTPEQRERRNSLKREREQDKRASRSPAEKEMVRTDRRRILRQKQYGPDFDEKRLHLKQGKKCAICKTPLSLEEMVLDHDHVTEKLRGGLCRSCNLKLLSSYEKFPAHRQDSPYLNAYLARGKLQ